VSRGALAEKTDDREKRSLYCTSLLVLSLHAVIFFWLGATGGAKSFPAPKHRVVVQTVKLDSFKAETLAEHANVKAELKESHPDTSLPIENKIQSQAKEKVVEEPNSKPNAKQPKSAAKPSEKVVSKQVNVKPAALDKVKKIEKKAEEIAVLEATKKKQALIEAVKASMSKIKKSESKNSELIEIKAESFAPLPIVSSGGSGHGEILGAKGISYAEEIASILKFFLQFPEYGEVDIALTLTRLGKVVDFHIVKSQNKANSKYVEANVKTIEFPPFGKNFPGESKRTFSIKLSMDTL